MQRSKMVIFGSGIGVLVRLLLFILPITKGSFFGVSKIKELRESVFQSAPLKLLKLTRKLMYGFSILLY